MLSKYKYCCVLLVSLLIGTTGHAQLSGPSTPGARGLALGGAGQTFTDIHAAWSNPAGLADVDATSFALFGEQRFGLSEIRNVRAAGAIHTSSGTLGLALGYYGFDSYNQQRIGLLYARPLNEKVSIGAQFYGLSTRITEYGSQMKISAELGVQGQISPSVRLGARVANPIRIEVLNEEYLPTILSVGIQYQPADQLSLFADVEKDVLYPASMRIGAEYELLDALTVRLGFATQATQLSFGVGYLLKEQWRLHFAAAYHQYLGFTPGFGVSFAQ